MLIQPVDAQARPDRFSTSDEIQSALSSLPDFYVERGSDSLWEVPSDLGGRVLIETEEIEGSEAFTLLEKLDTTAN